MMKIVSFWFLILYSSAIFAFDLFNSYDIHEYTDFSVGLESGSINVDLMPTIEDNGEVTVVGSPFTLRIVCISEYDNVCPIRIGNLQVMLDGEAYTSINNFNWRENSFDGMYYSTLLVGGFNFPKDRNVVCISTESELTYMRDICLTAITKEFKRFFLFDWWASI